MTIRPLEERDLGQVAAIYERTFRSGSTEPPAGLALRFKEFFLDTAVSQRVRSLVYLRDERTVGGFLGIQPRRMLLDGRPVLAACVGPFAMDPASGTAGTLFVLRELLRGPQELTFTDGASHQVRGLWERLGADVHELACLEWTRMFQPTTFMTDRFSRRRPRIARITTPLARLGRPLLRSADALLRLSPRAGFSARASDLDREGLTTRNLLDACGTVLRRWRLRPDYDDVYLEWTFAEMRRFEGRGQFHGRLVRKNDEVVGWYIYFSTPDRLAQVAQLAALRSSRQSVLLALFEELDRSGAIAVQGRVDADWLEPLTQMGARIEYTPPLALFHSNNSEVRDAILSGRSMLSRLDGDWWQVFYLDRYEETVGAREKADARFGASNEAR